MRKGMIGTVAALFIVGAPMAHAQQAAPAPGGTPDSGRLNQAEFKMLTDIRVGVIRAALQLTPEQEKLWPAVEEAIAASALFSALRNSSGEKTPREIRCA